MDSFEWNKIFGAVLATALFVMILREVSAITFHEKELSETAIKVEVPEDGAGGQAAQEEKGPVDFGRLIPAASAEAGKRIAAVCLGCHSFEKGGPNGVGPNLWGILGEDVAHLADFPYSRAMANYEGVWTYENMYNYLENPQGYLPGTNMAFAGLKQQRQRLNILAYMREMSDNPPPLPEPLPEEAPEEAPATEATEQPASGG